MGSHLKIVETSDSIDSYGKTSVDYSLSYLTAKKKIHNLYNLLLSQRYDQAKNECLEIIAETRMLLREIELHQEREQWINAHTANVN